MKVSRYLSLLLVLGLCFVVSGCFFIQNTYNLEGRVTDMFGKGIANVTLSFGQRGTVVTDGDGRWTKTGLSGTVTITPTKEGCKFYPPERIVKSKNDNVSFRRAVHSVLWYSADDYIQGSWDPVAPTMPLIGDFSVSERLERLDVLPENYDVLVLSDTGFGGNLDSFAGNVIISFDSAVEPVVKWATGNVANSYWDYGTGLQLKWATPFADDETGAEGDARISTSLDGVAGLIRRSDLICAASTEGYDDIIAYEVAKGDRKWMWFHIGPHFGNYAYDYTEKRVSQVVDYCLRLVNGESPELSAPPVMPPPRGITSSPSRNK